MKAGARLYIDLPDKQWDLVAPSVEPLMGFTSRLLSGWMVSELLDLMKFRRDLHFVDVGACIGSWGILMATRYPSVSVTCIEPVPLSYQCLLYNARGITNLKTINAAADDKDGIVHLSLPDFKYWSDHTPLELWHNYGLMSGYGEPDKEAVDVQAHPLDDMVGKVDLLKIDVEGMEARVLAGAQRILTQDRPLIQIELVDRNQVRANKTAKDIHDMIVSYGYTEIATDTTDGVYLPNERIEHG